MTSSGQVPKSRALRASMGTFTYPTRWPHPLTRWTACRGEISVSTWADRNLAQRFNSTFRWSLRGARAGDLKETTLPLPAGPSGQSAATDKVQLSGHPKDNPEED